MPARSSSDKALRDQETVGVNFLTTGAKNRGSQMGAKKVSIQPSCIHFFFLFGVVSICSVRARGILPSLCLY
jgi:hypothetical protein